MPVCAAIATLKLCPAPVTSVTSMRGHEVLAEAAVVPRVPRCPAVPVRPPCPAGSASALPPVQSMRSRWVHTFCSRNSRALCAIMRCSSLNSSGMKMSCGVALADQEFAALEGLGLGVGAHGCGSGDRRSAAVAERCYGMSGIKLCTHNKFPNGVVRRVRLWHGSCSVDPSGSTDA